MTSIFSAKDSADNTFLYVCIMVKDEHERLLVTLNSVKPISKYISIVLLDTGSTDDTIKIARNFCSENKIPFYLKEQRFDINSKGEKIIFDFRVSRNVLGAYADEISVSGPRGEEQPNNDKQKNKESNKKERGWNLLLDSNDEVRNPMNIITLLKSGISPETIGFYIKQEWDYGTKLDKFINIRIIRSNSGFLYGASNPHEALINPKYDISRALTSNENRKLVDFMDVVIFQDRTKDNGKSVKRFTNDKLALKKEIDDLSPEYNSHYTNNTEKNNAEKNDSCNKKNNGMNNNEKNAESKYMTRFHEIPRDKYGVYTRCLFYMGQTCFGLKELQEAFKYYEMRARHDSIFEEEVYISLLQCAKLSYLLGHDSEESVLWATKAFQKIPRADALLHIADVYINNYCKNKTIIDGKPRTNAKDLNSLILAHMYALQACDMSFPEAMLFIDENLYTSIRWKMLCRINIELLAFERLDSKKLIQEGLNACNKIVDLKDEDIKIRDAFVSMTK